MVNIRWGFIILLVCTVFTALGQLLFKFASNTFSFNIISLITNYYLIFGGVFYAFGVVLLMVALKFGELSKLYPFVSLNFVWVTLLSVFLLGEKLNSFKINAIILVISGVILVGGSGK